MTTTTLTTFKEKYNFLRHNIGISRIGAIWFILRFCYPFEVREEEE